MKRYGEHLEDECEKMPRTTAYRYRRRMREGDVPQKNNADSESADDVSLRENLQPCLPRPRCLSNCENSSSSTIENADEFSPSSTKLSSEETSTQFSLQEQHNSHIESSTDNEQYVPSQDQDITEQIAENNNAAFRLRNSNSSDNSIRFVNTWVDDTIQDIFDNSELDDNNSMPTLDDNNSMYRLDDHDSIGTSINAFSEQFRFERLKKILQDEENDSIHVNMHISKSEIYLAILKYGLTYNLCQTGIADLFKMINCIFRTSIFPDTRYLVDKIFSDNSYTEFHAVCPSCKMYIKKFDKDQERQVKCNVCEKRINLKDPTYNHFFAIMNVENEIATLIKNNADHYFSIVNKRRTNNEHIEDLTDGDLYKKLSTLLPTNEHFVTCTFNTDGSPLFESSNSAIWPIQLIINEMPYEVRTKNPIVCGMWFGKDKPDMNVFLSPLVVLLNKLSQKGIKCVINDEELSIKVNTICSCVDSVARAPMQGMIQFNGYYGCNWCMHPGEYVRSGRGGSVKYVLLDYVPPIRTENETIQYMQQTLTVNNPVYGIKKPSCLINLQHFNIISSFVPDSMHCVCLGVADQFLSYWLDSSKEPYSLTNNDIARINNFLLSVKSPNQIVRLSRPVSDRRWWKSREWENWILYYSIPILSAFPHMTIYKQHWALLVEAFYILSKDRITRAELENADLLLKKFVVYTEVYYTKSAMTYNVHQLLHLVQSVVDWGPLWSHSGYAFENGNGQLVRKVQAAKGVVHQLCRIISMQQSLFILQDHIALKPHTPIHAFVSYLDVRQATKSCKIAQSRYFGLCHRTKLRWIQGLQLSNHSRSFYKMVKDHCLYNSSKRKRLRSDNSFATNKDGSYIQIIEFIVDQETQKEYTLCNRLNVTSISDGYTGIKKVLTISEEISVIDTNTIDKVCVFLNIDNMKYICSVPNNYYY